MILSGIEYKKMRKDMETLSDVRMNEKYGYNWAPNMLVYISVYGDRDDS